MSAFWITVLAWDANHKKVKKRHCHLAASMLQRAFQKASQDHSLQTSSKNKLHQFRVIQCQYNLRNVTFSFVAEWMRPIRAFLVGISCDVAQCPFSIIILMQLLINHSRKPESQNTFLRALRNEEDWICRNTCKKSIPKSMSKNDASWQCVIANLPGSDSTREGFTTDICYLDRLSSSNENVTCSRSRAAISARRDCENTSNQTWGSSLQTLTPLRNLQQYFVRLLDTKLFIKARPHHLEFHLWIHVLK